MADERAVGRRRCGRRAETGCRARGPCTSRPGCRPMARRSSTAWSRRSPAIFAIAPDGFGQSSSAVDDGRRTTRSTTSRSPLRRTVRISPSPLGRSDAGPQRVRTRACDPARTRALPDGGRHRYSRAAPPIRLTGSWSPTRGSLARDAFQIVVANADGSGDERPIGAKRPGPSWMGATSRASWAFAPDGTALVVRYGNDDAAAARLLPLDGSPGTDLGSRRSSSSSTSSAWRPDRQRSRAVQRPVSLHEAAGRRRACRVARMAA